MTLTYYRMPFFMRLCRRLADWMGLMTAARDPGEGMAWLAVTAAAALLPVP
jgi:hypothetical protein